jgi:hypothetical protein
MIMPANELGEQDFTYNMPANGLGEQGFTYTMQTNERSE